MFQKFKQWVYSNSVFSVGLASIFMIVFGATLILFGAKKANAVESFVGDEAKCNGVAMTAYLMATERDSGVTWADAQKMVLAGLKEVKGDEDSYVKTDEDVKSIYQLAQLIWSSNKKPGAIAEIAFTACMGVDESSNNI